MTMGIPHEIEAAIIKTSENTNQTALAKKIIAYMEAYSSKSSNNEPTNDDDISIIYDAIENIEINYDTE